MTSLQISNLIECGRDECNHGFGGDLGLIIVLTESLKIIHDCSQQVLIYNIEVEPAIHKV